MHFKAKPSEFSAQMKTAEAPSPPDSLSPPLIRSLPSSLSSTSPPAHPIFAASPFLRRYFPPTHTPPFSPSISSPIHSSPGTGPFLPSFQPVRGGSPSSASAGNEKLEGADRGNCSRVRLLPSPGLPATTTPAAAAAAALGAWPGGRSCEGAGLRAAPENEVELLQPAREPLPPPPPLSAALESWGELMGIAVHSPAASVPLRRLRRGRRLPSPEAPPASGGIAL